LKEAVELFIENAREIGMLEDVQESLMTREKFTTGLEVVVNA